MITKIQYSNNQVAEKRNEVREEFISLSDNINSGIIKQISTKDLRLLFDLYDKIFFADFFKDNLKGKLILSLSTKMTKAAGKTMVPRNIAKMNPIDIIYEIRMGVGFFFEYFALQRDKLVCGIVTKDALEAFQLVFEHELVHFIEYHEYKYSSCSKDRFNTIVHNLFKHTDTKHQLPTDREIVSTHYGFNISDKVTFEFEGKKLDGIINGINKRATVMVLDKEGRYADKAGNRYTKYYVPFGGIRKIE